MFKNSHIKCRVCNLNLLLKNYKSHLKNVHPDENVKDLRGANQLEISSSFSFRGKRQASPNSGQG